MTSAESARKYYWAHKEVCDEKCRSYYKTHTEEVRNRVIQRKYSLTLNDYNELLNRQQGTCAMCGGILIPGKSTHVDHDHVTKEVRGILCDKCNLDLGVFEKIRAYAEPYLQRS